VLGSIAVVDLPGEAQKTLVLIKRGGPYAYAKDGVVFGNYEGVLPKQKRGYYHEFSATRHFASCKESCLFKSTMPFVLLAFSKPVPFAV